MLLYVERTVESSKKSTVLYREGCWNGCYMVRSTVLKSARVLEFEKMKKWPIFWDEVFNGDFE